MIHMFAADKIGVIYWIFSRNAISTSYGTPAL